MASVLLNFNNKLGDNLICNGLVREYCARFERVGIFYIPRYKTSVSFMFRDLQNLSLIETRDQSAKERFLWRHTLHLTREHFDEIRTIGNDIESGIQAERQFYALAGVPHEKKWDSFFVERDPAREEALFGTLAPQGPYVFVHDDAIYGGGIDRARMPRLPEVFPQNGVTNNIFDYCTLIERATEVHVVDSVFMFLVDLLPYDTQGQKLFVHRYARQNPPWKLPVLRKDWSILT